MNKSIYLSILFILLVVVSANARVTNLVYNADLGLWIGTDDNPDVKPTEEELFVQKMRDALPYGHGMYLYHQRRSLGQLIKICDYIIVGTVIRFTALSDTETETEYEKGTKVSLSIKIENVMFGTIPDAEINVSTYWRDDDKIPMEMSQGPYNWNWKKRPKLGDKLLMFLSDAQIDEYIGDEFRFDFVLNRKKKSGLYYIVRENGGVRYLDTPEVTTNYLNAVNGYLRELRLKKRNADDYYSFLADIIQSPVQSIREDARSDLIYFVETCPSFNKSRILVDNRVDEALKFWINRDTIPKKSETP